VRTRVCLQTGFNAAPQSEYSEHMVGLGRVELPTNGLGNRCSIHLSYRPSAQFTRLLHISLQGRYFAGRAPNLFGTRRNGNMFFDPLANGGSKVYKFHAHEFARYNVSDSATNI
jgi:hypothetical protein